MVSVEQLCQGLRANFLEHCGGLDAALYDNFAFTFTLHARQECAKTK